MYIFEFSFLIFIGLQASVMFSLKKEVVVLLLAACVLILYVFLRRSPSNSAHDVDTTRNTPTSDVDSLKSHYEVYYGIFEEKHFAQEIVRIGGMIKEKSRVVLLGMLNEAYIPFTYSWLCNTLPMGIHRNVLLLTTDTNSTNLLQKDWPQVQTVHLPVTTFQGDLEYSKAGYVKMMNLRTQVINLLLRKNIPLILFETDSMWIKNPVPEVLQSVQGHDLLVVKPSHKHGYLGGFMCLLPTVATLEIWRQLSERMLKLHDSLVNLKNDDPVADATNDQVFFSKIIEKERKRIKLYELSNMKVVDGKWYTDFTESDRKKMKPLVINNNWLRGNKVKISRAKKWGHWFLNENLDCDMKQVNKIIDV